MSGPDWYRWYPTKWLSGTLCLTNEQRGVYIQIVNVILDRGSCPNDEEYLMRLCGDLHRRVLRRLLKELVSAGKIVINGESIEQTRAKLERKDAETFVQNQSNRALKRWKNKNLDDAISGICHNNHTESKKTQTPPSSTEDSTNLLPKKTPSGGVSLNGEAKPKRARALGEAMPEDWKPSAEAIRYCRMDMGCPNEVLNETYRSFKDWGLSVTGPKARKRDWDRAFINAVRSRLREIREREARERRWAEQRRQQ
jgi:regulator of protease activity HflC (stomatin/prohibitin superfamily)